MTRREAMTEWGVDHLPRARALEQLRDMREQIRDNGGSACLPFTDEELKGLDALITDLA